MIQYRQQTAEHYRRIVLVRAEIAGRLRRCLRCKLAPARPLLAVHVAVWADTVTGSMLYDLLKLAGLAAVLAAISQCHP